MKLGDLPVIDWELSMQLAGNRKEVAKELMDYLIQELPNNISEINQLYNEKNYSILLQRVHKLHGALCYCGLPRLKTLISYLETDLKNNIIFSLPTLLHQLDAEVKLVLEHQSHPTP